MSASEKKVLVVLLNWNGLDFTRDCCASLSRQCHTLLDVWVVDNGSTEHTVEELKSACPGVQILALDHNHGFAGGVNAGLGAANWQQYDYIWLLNNDTICDPDALSRLVAVAESDAQLGAVGCAMREGDEATGGVKMVQAGKCMRAPWYIPFEPESIADVDYLCGASTLIRREALESVGLLDESFFFFFEDADWSFRAKSHGWKLGIAEGTPIRHMGGGTIRRNTSNRARFYRLGYVLFLRRHARHPILASVVLSGYRIGVDVVHLNWGAVRGTWAGFWAGWSKNI